MGSLWRSFWVERQQNSRQPEAAQARPRGEARELNTDSGRDLYDVQLSFSDQTSGGTLLIYSI